MHPSIGMLGTLLLLLFPTVAAAEGRVGGGGGRGRLGQVTSRIDTAASSGSARGTTTPSSDDADHGELYQRRSDGADVIVVTGDGTVVRRIKPRTATGGSARLDLFVGVQKVIESDRSYALSLAIADKWFRLAGAISEYREQQTDGTRTGLTLPTLVFGARVLGGRGGSTHGFVEGGIANARTREDSMTGSNLTGPIIGVHLEHSLGGPLLIGDVHVMVFDAGLKAFSGRVGLRASHLEIGFRVLDFNVGPALYGPEVGFQF
jgi:hypothetical protein